VKHETLCHKLIVSLARTRPSSLEFSAVGYHFKIEHANVVAYLSSAGSTQPPRLTVRELRSFLGALRWKKWPSRARDTSCCVPYELDSSAPTNLISSSSEWVSKIHDAADRAMTKIDRAEHSEDLIPAVSTANYLSELRPLFNQYTFFAMPVSATRANPELKAFCEYAAYSSGPHGLILIPDDFASDQGLRVLDPFPGLGLVAENPQKWPGILFWSNSGNTIFTSLRDAYAVYSELLQVGFEQDQLDRSLQKFRTTERYDGPATILQLSDLHFGTPEALELEPYLLTRLQSISKSIKRVVITGDLFNAPKRPEALAFNRFRNSLNREWGQDAVVIPGNHDQKWMGNFGSPIGELANLDWSSLVVDDNIGCVFFCFDSSRDADLARGTINPQQRLDVALLFDTQCLARTEIKDYLRIALIHHHPFTFETGKETLVARGLERFGITDEYFLRMDDADSFLQWCAARNVGLILHGHKHVPRYVQKQLVRTDGSVFVLTSVGCGTSLGAEGKPLSYNTLGWNRSNRQWTVSFFADPGDGGGFSRQQVSLRHAD